MIRFLYNQSIVAIITLANSFPLYEQKCFNRQTITSAVNTQIKSVQPIKLIKWISADARWGQIIEKNLPADKRWTKNAYVHYHLHPSLFTQQTCSELSSLKIFIIFLQTLQMMMAKKVFSKILFCQQYSTTATHMIPPEGVRAWCGPS